MYRNRVTKTVDIEAIPATPWRAYKIDCVNERAAKLLAGQVFAKERVKGAMVKPCAALWAVWVRTDDTESTEI